MHCRSWKLHHCRPTCSSSGLRVWGSGFQGLDDGVGVSSLALQSESRKTRKGQLRRGAGRRQESVRGDRQEAGFQKVLGFGGSGFGL